ncbi:MAG: hypothetical protein V1834_00730 [Candidatus Micrarchaeota archaeon]
MAQDVVTVLMGFIVLALLLQGAYGLTVVDFVSGVFSWFSPANWGDFFHNSVSTGGLGGFIWVALVFVGFIWLLQYSFFDILGGMDGLMMVLVFLLFLLLVI